MLSHSQSSVKHLNIQKLYANSSAPFSLHWASPITPTALTQPQIPPSYHKPCAFQPPLISPGLLYSPCIFVFLAHRLQSVNAKGTNKRRQKKSIPNSLSLYDFTVFWGSSCHLWWRQVAGGALQNLTLEWKMMGIQGERSRQSLLPHIGRHTKPEQLHETKGGFLCELSRGWWTWEKLHTVPWEQGVTAAHVPAWLPSVKRESPALQPPTTSTQCNSLWFGTEESSTLLLTVEKPTGWEQSPAVSSWIQNDEKVFMFQWSYNCYSSSVFFFPLIFTWGCFPVGWWQLEASNKETIGKRSGREGGVPFLSTLIIATIWVLEINTRQNWNGRWKLLMQQIFN